MNQIVSKAREYVGTPFHHQGRVKGVGIDCVGLLVGIARDLGFDGKDYTQYSMRPDGKKLVEQIRKSCTRLPDNHSMLPGDILVFFFIGPTWPQHTGIYCGEGKMIHTYSDIGRVVEHRLDKTWLESLHSIWRFRPGNLIEEGND